MSRWIRKHRAVSPLLPCVKRLYTPADASEFSAAPFNLICRISEMFSHGFASLENKGPKPLIHEGKATRGKHAGATLEWLYKNEPAYLIFIYENSPDHGLTADQYKTAQLAKEQLDELKSEDNYARRGTRYDAFWGGEFGDKD